MHNSISIMKIIVNADDFGKSLNRNRAIDDAFRQGMITSMGVIVTGKYLQNALEYMEAGNYYEHVHLHLNVSTNLLDEDSCDAPLTKTMRNDPFFCIDGMFKPYHGLPQGKKSVLKWKMVYDELVAQYKRFIEVTKGRGDASHVDFHLWYNLTWPVSVALYFFLKNYHIKSVRLIGMHQVQNKQYRLYSRISSNHYLKTYPATNIDYYISRKELFKDEQIVELYCHPDYRNGIWLDNSPSYLKHERQSMIAQMQMLKDTGSYELISWKDIADGRSV